MACENKFTSQDSRTFKQRDFDAIIVGAGISGSFIANEMCQKGLKVLLLEAGKHFNKNTYPTREIDANSQLYWSGGIELNTSASIGILRPKGVGGGSIVNQALVDRFDSIALDSWKEQSGVSFFTQKDMAPWYDSAEKELAIQEIPEQYRNGNAKIFQQGFEKNNYKWAPLKRAQKDCHFEDGNDCIECLSGCRIDSKQSMGVTVLKKALAKGLYLLPEFEVLKVSDLGDSVKVLGIDVYGERRTFRAKKLVMASGAIGNSKLLLNSGFASKLPALGENFYTHPQSMVLGLYDQDINAHKGPLQSLKSDDTTFRANYFKLENVFAPPVAIAMLVPKLGHYHLDKMRRISNMACIEVAIRDTHAGKITTNSKGKVQVHKELDTRDKETQEKGLAAIYRIFNSTGAKEIVNGSFAIGLHLMGGLGIGTNDKKSVVTPDFNLHGFKNIFAADSSIFPNAPGINPSFTIMALSKMASDKIIRSWQ